MKLPGYLILTVLGIVFLFAANQRSASLETAPYFSGTSSLNFLHTQAVANGKSPGALVDRAGWPDGYAPARDRACGAEWSIGMVTRLARYLGETSDRRVARRVIATTGALCAVVMYLLVSGWWQCQAAGLLSALLTAFWVPLVTATDGRSFAHAPFVAFFAISLLLGLHRTFEGRRLGAGIATISTVALLAVSEAAVVLIGTLALVVAVMPGPTRAFRVRTLVMFTAVLILASLAFPWLRETAAWGSWPIGASAAALVVVLFESLLRPLWARLIVMFALTGVFSGLGALVHPDTADTGYPALRYALERIRFLSGKPESSRLADAMRYAWSPAHAPLPLQSVFSLILPLVFLIPTTTLVSRRRCPRRLAAGLVFAVVGGILCVVDRSLVAPFAPSLVVVASGGVRGISRAGWVRRGLVGMGVAMILLEATAPTTYSDIPFQAAGVFDAAQRDPAQFPILSTENTDRELVRFVTRHTSVRDAFFAPPEISSVLASFAGRRVTAIPGSARGSSAIRAIQHARLWYSTVSNLRDACDAMRVKYVVYSADIFLNRSRWSPQYLAGTSVPDESSVARHMHFFPESLDGFSLVYENDRYRVYRVVDHIEPAFITDHPPVFQPKLFAASGSDIEAFRARVGATTLMYWKGIQALRIGDYDNAETHLAMALRFAPQYTRARVARASARIQLGEYKEAREELRSVLSRFPDDAEALYQAAWVNAAVGDTRRATGLLDVLLTTPATQELLDRARLLRTLIERGVPITPRALSERPVFPPGRSDVESADTARARGETQPR